MDEKRIENESRYIDKPERENVRPKQRNRKGGSDTRSYKTKRRKGKKNTGEWKRKLLKKGRQGRKTKKRKGEANIQKRTATGGEEKSE